MVAPSPTPASTAASTITLLPTAVNTASKSSTAATPSPTVSLTTTRSRPPGETPSISLIPKAGTYPAITSTASARTPSGPTGCTARRSPITTSRTSGTGRPPVRGTALPARHRAASGPRSTPTRSATTAPARTAPGTSTWASRRPTTALATWRSPATSSLAPGHATSGSTSAAAETGWSSRPAEMSYLRSARSASTAAGSASATGTDQSPPAAPLRPRAAAAQSMHTCLAQVEDERVDGDHGHDDEGRVGEPVVGCRLPRLGQVVERHDDRYGAERGQHAVPDRVELRWPVFAVVERQGQVGEQVYDQDQDRPHGGGLVEEGDRVHRAGAAVHSVQQRPDTNDRQGDGDEREDRVHRGSPGGVHLADPAWQQALAAFVEYQPGLGVRARDESTERGEAREVGEERE